MFDKKKFVVDDIHYVVEFVGNEFFLYVDGRKVRTKIYEDDDDGFDFYSSSETRILKSSDLIAAKHPIKIYREVMEFVGKILAVNKPHMFTYSANEDKKIAVYSSVAARIAKKFGYYFVQDGANFTFFKMA